MPRNIYIQYIAFRDDQMVVIETNAHDNCRVSFYTTKCNDGEEPMKAIDLGSNYITDLKVCERSGMIYICKIGEILAISSDYSIHTMNLNRKESCRILCAAPTINGDLLVFNFDNNVSCFSPIGDGSNFDYRLVEEFDISDHVVTSPGAISKIVSLPNQQIAILEENATEIVVFDV